MIAESQLVRKFFRETQRAQLASVERDHWPRPNNLGRKLQRSSQHIAKLQDNSF